MPETTRTWSKVVQASTSTDAPPFPTPPSDSPTSSPSHQTTPAPQMHPFLNLEQPIDAWNAQQRPNANKENHGPWSAPFNKGNTLSEARSPVSVPPGLDDQSLAGWKSASARLRTNSTPNHLFEPLQRPTLNTQSPVNTSWGPWSASTALPSNTLAWDNDPLLAHPSEIPRPKSGMDAPQIPDFLKETPPPRQQRSMSFSMGTTLQPTAGGLLLARDDEDMNKHLDAFKARVAPPRNTFDVLSNVSSQDTAEEDGFGLGKPRSRSKSSSAIYSLAPAEEDDELLDQLGTLSMSQNAVAPGIWNSTPSDGNHHRIQSSLYHRRASTQPNSALLWEAAHHPTNDPVTENGQVMMNAEQLERYRQERRFSHAPTIMKEYTQRMMINRAPGAPPIQENPYDINLRRHSLGAPVLDARHAATHKMVEEMDRMGLSDKGPILTEINDYFENTQTRAKAWAEAGKNLQSAAQTHFSSENAHPSSPSSPYSWPLFVVEFKAGRTDFFYTTPDFEGTVKKGDIVIVEADRGKDLGKIIEDNITTVQQLQYYQVQLAEKLPELHSVNKPVVPKRMYRAAQPAEVTMLFAKSQDEAKAMSICQSKIRQKNLPMEVVDAEYQWDRRKLTFYFVADRRIDFRELVRDLFKIYKTRIWMYVFTKSTHTLRCAVNMNPASL